MAEIEVQDARPGVNARRRAVMLLNLIDALRFSWSAKTAAAGTVIPGPGCPHGQCAVTALVVQDHLGGALLRAEIPGRGSHYWNLIPAVGELDLTREQFPADLEIPRGVEVPRSRLLEGERSRAALTPERYDMLKQRVIDHLLDA
jgi:hypothetical protein